MNKYNDKKKYYKAARLRITEVDVDCFRMSDMQNTVRLGRETSNYLQYPFDSSTKYNAHAGRKQHVVVQSGRNMVR